MLRALLAATLLPLSGCIDRADSILQEPPLDARPAIVLIPGFYGTALREKGGGRRIYASGWEAFFGRHALSLFPQSLHTPEAPELEVEGVIGNVVVVPWLYEVDAYGPFAKRLRESFPSHQIVPLAYDWRDDLLLAVHRLEDLLTRLRAAGAPSVQLVSHSMGGMVATYYLAYGTQEPEEAKANWQGSRNVQRAVFFGTPFQGSMIAFRSFLKGSGLPHSQRLLSADAMSSFPSMFQLIPRSASLLDRSARRFESSLFDFDLWRRNQLGLLRRHDLPAEARDARALFVSQQLARARAWSDRLQLSGLRAPASLRLLNVISKAHRTLHAGYLDEPSTTLWFDPDETKAAGLAPEPLFTEGDLTVSATSASVPEALADVTKTLVVSSPHDTLFLDPEAEKEYKLFLAETPPPNSQ